MVPDRQKVWTMDERTDAHTDDAKTISLRLRRGIIIHCQVLATTWAKEIQALSDIIA